MITSSLRRAVRSHTRASPSSVAASFSSRSHQRRQSSSKPPVPPNDGPTNVANPSVKTVATPRSKDVTAERRLGAESRLSRRKIPRDRSEHAPGSTDEWAVKLPSVPTTQHLDPKDIYVASFFANHRPMSITSSVPLSATEEVFQSIFTPKKSTSKSRAGTAEVIYTLASAVHTLDNTIEQDQTLQQNRQQGQQDQTLQQNRQQGQQDRSGVISVFTQSNHPDASSTPEPQHLDGAPHQTINLRVPNGVKLAIQQIAQQFRPFNTPPAPHPITDAQIEAKEAENAAAAEEAEEEQARQLHQQIEQQDPPHPPRHVVINIHGRAREGEENRFFTPYPPHPQSAYEINEEQANGVYYEPNASVLDPEPQGSIGRIRQSHQEKSPTMQRRKMYAISVKRQRRMKMKKHKFKKLLRRTRTLRKKLDKL